MRLLRHRDVDPADHRGVLQEHLDQPLLCKAHQGIAVRRRTGAELPGQAVARQRRPSGSASEVVCDRRSMVGSEHIFMAGRRDVLP